MVKDIKHYQPKGMGVRQLSDDWRIVCAWYATAQDSKRKFKYTMNEILELAGKIYREILERKRAGSMKHVFNPGEMTESSKQLYDYLKKEYGTTGEEAEETAENELMEISPGNTSERGSMIKLRDLLEPLIDKEFMVAEDVITLVGSLANHNETDGDVDLLLKNPADILSVMKFRLQRFPQLKKIIQRVQFLDNDPRGPFTNHVHLADLVVKFKNPFVNHRMSADSVNQEELRKFSSNKNYSMSSCMDCQAAPEFEVKWAEGMAHAWFCKMHFEKFAKSHLNDIDYVKAVRDGKAASKFKENPNPNIWDSLRRDLRDAMNSESDDSIFAITAMMSAGVNFSEDAKKSLVEDEVIPGRGFYQQKPIHGRDVGEQYSTFGTADVVKREWYYWTSQGVLVSKKYDGITCQIHVKEDESVMILTEEGSDITPNIPTIIRELEEKKLKPFVAIGEIEMWKDGKHLPRAEAAAACNNKPSDSEGLLQLTIYDVLYWKQEGGDLHNKPYSFRRFKYLTINQSKHVRVSTFESLCHTERELSEAISKHSNEAGSEGAMIKHASGVYELKIHPKNPGMIKFKNEKQVNAVVTGIHKIEGAEAWVYSIATKDEGRLNKGMLLTEPHAELIYTGKKTAILKKKKYDIAGREFILVGDKAYGILSIGRNPKLITNLDEFKATSAQHLVSDEELKKWWNNEFPLQLWDFKFYKFDSPKEYEKTQGPQAFVNNIKISGLPGMSKTWVSKTYSTGIKANPGDVIQVSFVDASEYFDPKTTQIWFNLWAPHVIKIMPKGTPTTGIEELEKIVNETSGRSEVKKIPDEPLEYTPEGATPITKNSALDARQIQSTKKWIAFIEDHKEWPEAAQEDFGFAVTWADGRALVTYKFKKDAIDFIKQGDREVAAVSYGKRKEGAKIRTKFIPDKSAKNSKDKKFVIQFHIRGGTTHGDFRFENDAGSLDGFTMLIQKPKEFAEKLKWKLEKDELTWDGKTYYKFKQGTDDVIEKPSKELEQEVFNFHKNLVKDKSLWKIDLDSGEELERESGEKQVMCVKKDKEPHNWIDAEGITLPREIEEEPGGTRYYPGILIKLDSGDFERGAEKQYYKELFLNGEKWKGRVIFREHSLDKDSASFQWLYEKTKDNTPYVIDKRAIAQEWLPEGYSALPSSMEYLIPPGDAYWLKGLSKSERLERRLRVAEFFKNKTKNETDDFILSKREWHGQKVIRDLPQVTYFLKLGNQLFSVENNPTSGQSTAAEIPLNDAFWIPGEKSPGTIANPNKEIPAFIELIDNGKYDVVSKSDVLINVNMKGELLKGEYSLRRSTKDAKIWVMEKNQPQ